MTISQSYIDGLPIPAVIEAVSYEEIRQAVLDELISLDPSYTAILESDPAVKVIEACCYHILLLRTRVNDAARANLLAFATESDLDHLSAFYDVTRLAGEGDAALRQRTILAIQARSPGGSEFWYAAAARRTDVRIRDVKVYREPILPIIHVSVLSSENNGVPDEAMLAAVTEEVTSDMVRLLNDQIVVEAAVTQTVSISAEIWLLPNAPQSVFDNLESVLRKAWNDETGIGFDLEPSWIDARLHVSGVKKVRITYPVAPVIAAPGTAVALGDITLTLMGRDY